jgi:hypothetical protein
MTEVYDPDDDVEKIHNAFEENKYDIITEILCKRKNKEIQDIKNRYSASYGEMLDDKITDNYKGNLKTLLLSLLKEPIDNDIDDLFSSMDGLGTDEDTLTEIIVTTPPYKFKEIAEKYEKKYSRKLEDDIKSDTSSEYRRLLIAIIQGNRRENPYPNIKKIKEMVSELKVEEGEKLDKDIFIKHFALSSPSEIIMLFYYYEKQYKQSLLEVIENSFGSDSFNLYKTLVDYYSNPSKYYATRLNTWKDKIVIRTFSNRREIDLDDIKKEYKKLYDKELIDDLKYNKKDEFGNALEFILLNE